MKPPVHEWSREQVSMIRIGSPRSMKIVKSWGTMGTPLASKPGRCAMVRVRKPVEQVGAGRRRNHEVTPPSGEFDRENL